MKGMIKSKDSLKVIKLAFLIRSYYSIQLQEEICDHLLNQAERTKITRSRNKLRKKWLDGILTVARKSALTFEENSKTKKKSTLDTKFFAMILKIFF